MTVPVVLPELGTGDRPIRLSMWLVERGEHVTEGDRLLEVVWDAVTFDVPAPATGRVIPRIEGHRPEVSSGDVLGWIEPDGDDRHRSDSPAREV